MSGSVSTSGAAGPSCTRKTSKRSNSTSRRSLRKCPIPATTLGYSPVTRLYYRPVTGARQSRSGGPPSGCPSPRRYAEAGFVTNLCAGRGTPGGVRGSGVAPRSPARRPRAGRRRAAGRRARPRPGLGGRRAHDRQLRRVGRTAERGAGSRSTTGGPVKILVHHTATANIADHQPRRRRPAGPGDPEVPHGPPRLARHRPALHGQPRRRRARGTAPQPGVRPGRAPAGRGRALHGPERRRAGHRERGHLQHGRPAASSCGTSCGRCARTSAGSTASSRPRSTGTATSRTPPAPATGSTPRSPPAHRGRRAARAESSRRPR